MLHSNYIYGNHKKKKKGFYTTRFVGKLELTSRKKELKRRENKIMMSQLDGRSAEKEGLLGGLRSVRKKIMGAVERNVRNKRMDD